MLYCETIATGVIQSRIVVRMCKKHCSLSKHGGINMMVVVRGPDINSINNA